MNITKIVNSFYRYASGMKMEHKQDPKGRRRVYKPSEDIPKAPSPEPPKIETFEATQEPYDDDYWKALREQRISWGDTEDQADEYVSTSRIIDTMSSLIMLELKKQNYKHKPLLIQLSRPGESLGVWRIDSLGKEYRPAKSFKQIDIAKKYGPNKPLGIKKKIEEELDPNASRLRGRHFPDVVQLKVDGRDSGNWVYDDVNEVYVKDYHMPPVELMIDL